MGERAQDRIELFFLPSYSPTSTRTNGSGKREERHVAREVPQRRAHLLKSARRALRRLHAAPAKIRAFFADPHLAYIRRATPKTRRNSKT